MISALAAGVVLGLSAGLSPGPLLALVIEQALRHGTKEGVKVAVSPFITDLPIVLLATLVLTRLAGFQGILGGITLAGSLFVAYLAWESLRARELDAAAAPAAPQSLGKGILVNALSPHPYLFWLTVGAPILVKAWTENRLAAAGFLAGFYTCLVGSKVLVAVSVGRSRHFLTGRRYVYVMRILGALLLIFAGLLFWKGLSLLVRLGR